MFEIFKNNYETMCSPFDTLSSKGMNSSFRVIMCLTRRCFVFLTASLVWNILVPIGCLQAVGGLKGFCFMIVKGNIS